MDRSITFTADEALIAEVHLAALAENTTLEEQFRLWLEQCARKRQAARALATIEEMRKYINTGGRKFSRDELNERR
jgi:hypothetical protein